MRFLRIIWSIPVILFAAGLLARPAQTCLISAIRLR